MFITISSLSGYYFEVTSFVYAFYSLFSRMKQQSLMK